MFFIFLSLVITQFFSTSLCPPKDSFQNLSIKFTSKNFPAALTKFKTQLLSSNISCDGTLLLTNSFNQQKGFTNVQCDDKRKDRSNGFQSDMMIKLANRKFSYKSSAYFIFPFNNKRNRLFIKDWIQWQITAINKTRQARGALKGRDAFSDIELEIWSSSYRKETDLCVKITVNQNENNSTYLTSTISSVTQTPEKVTRNKEINDTDKCLPYRYSCENIISNISNRVIELIDFVKQCSSVNSKKVVIVQTSTTIIKIPLTDGFATSLINENQSISGNLTKMMNQKKSDNEKFLKVLIFVMIIVLALILLVIFIACFVYHNNSRHRYRPTATP